MTSRVAAVLIVAFWLLMWGLLLKTELQPEGAALREVPVGHVLKLLFHHQQPSELFIHGDGTRLGHLRLLPRVMPEDGSRSLEFSGGAQIRIPGVPRQRITWEGIAKLTNSNELQRLDLGLMMYEPAAGRSPESRIDFAFDPISRIASYQVRSEGATTERQEIELTEKGVREFIVQLGMDPAILQSLQAGRGAPSKLFAERSTLQMRNEKIDTLLVKLTHNEQTLLEFHVSQLGQILSARTLIGWTLEPD